MAEDLELKDECQINRGGPAQTTNQDPDSGPDQNVVAVVLAAFPGLATWLPYATGFGR